MARYAAADAQTLVRWIDAGAPRGEGEDPLAEAQTQPRPEEWSLGQPDYIVTPSQTDDHSCHRRGGVHHQHRGVPVPKDAWLKGVVVRPDNKKVLHHVIVYLEPPEGTLGTAVGRTNGWSAGRREPSRAFTRRAPASSCAKGSKLRFQLHYTTYGKEAIQT